MRGRCSRQAGGEKRHRGVAHGCKIRRGRSVKLPEPVLVRRDGAGFRTSPSCGTEVAPRKTARADTAECPVESRKAGAVHDGAEEKRTPRRAKGSAGVRPVIRSAAASPFRIRRYGRVAQFSRLHPVHLCAISSFFYNSMKLPSGEQYFATRVYALFGAQFRSVGDTPNAHLREGGLFSTPQGWQNRFRDGFLVFTRYFGERVFQRRQFRARCSQEACRVRRDSKNNWRDCGVHKETLGCDKEKRR